MEKFVSILGAFKETGFYFWTSGSSGNFQICYDDNGRCNVTEFFLIQLWTLPFSVQG